MLKTLTPTLQIPVTEHDHTRGPADAPVTLVEYGDYECPHCARAFPIIEKLMEHFAGKLRVVYRHFPLMKMHPHAKHAAEVAESASAAGKFWEMHELLFRNQDKLEIENLRQYAEQLGLDWSQVESDLAAHTYSKRVTDDLAGGIRSGVNGTPTIFINGKRHSGYDRESLNATISELLK